MFYASLYGSFLVLNLVWTSRGIGQPEAFCAGTTAAYRNGNGSDSALIPFTTLRLLLTPAPVDVHPAWRAGFDTCHGSDICDGTNWAKVQADAEAAGVYSAVVLTLTMLILLGNTVLIIKKHTAGLAISWKLLAVMPLLYFPMPFILAAVSAPAQALRFRANEVAGLPSPIPLCTTTLPLRLCPSPVLPATQFYEMAAKDKVCGNNLVALKDLDLGAWIDRPGDVDCKDKKWNAPSTWYVANVDKLLPPWPEAVGKLMLLKNCWGGFDPCAATTPRVQDYNRFLIWFMPIIWYFGWYCVHRTLVWDLWCYKEELVKAARRVQPLTAVTAAAAAAANAAAPPPRRTVVREAPQPQTFWPPALCVESVSPSAPVPPAFICPITMAPMANPAITPRGTSYDREALSDWISNEHRYPGGEARAAHTPHTPATHGARLFDAALP